MKKLTTGTIRNIIFGTLIAALLLCGCGSASSAKSYSADSAAAYYDEPVAEAAYAEEEAWDYDNYDYGDEDIAMENGATVETVTFAENKKIIYQSNVVIETLEYSKTYAKLIELINKYNGYIEYENYQNELRSYLKDNSGKGKLVISTNNLTIRIPSENYSAFMQEGLSLGNVLNRNQTVEDKTSEYNTNKSYVDILNDEADYLAKQLDVLEDELKAAQANDKHYDEIIENMKDIAERKAQVEKELVPYRRTMDDIDEKVAYSTITMELREVDEYTVIEKEPEPEPTFASELAETWNNAVSLLSNMCKGTLLFLIRILPVLIYLGILGLIALLIIFIVKKNRKKHPKPPKAPKMPKGQPPVRQPMPNQQPQAPINPAIQKLQAVNAQIAQEEAQKNQQAANPEGK